RMTRVSGATVASIRGREVDIGEHHQIFSQFGSGPHWPAARSDLTAVLAYADARRGGVAGGGGIAARFLGVAVRRGVRWRARRQRPVLVRRVPGLGDRRPALVADDVDARRAARADADRANGRLLLGGVAGSTRSEPGCLELGGPLRRTAGAGRHRL